MYCNSCGTIISKDDITYCEQCGVPLHKECANHCITCGKILCDTCSLENNFKCEGCYKPDNMFPVIRRSHLEQYAGCPYSVYLQLVLKYEPPMGAAAQLGVIVHKLIEEDLTREDMHTELDKRVTEFNKSISEEDIDYSHISDELLNNGHLCIDNYNKIRNYFTDKNGYTEYNIKFSLDEDLPEISCTLDKIIDDNGRLEVHDWKTGKPMAGKKLITDLQPALYMYAVYTKLGRMPDSFTLHYIREDKDIVYNKVNDDTYEVQTKRNTYVLKISEALERTKEILNGIKHNKFNMPDEKTHMFRCKRLCWFGISGKCQGSQDEQWRALNKTYGR